jgi:polar amino acid transport system substrate-binding protein
MTTFSLAEVVKDLAPKGTLRAAINFGNPVLAQRDPATGEPRGVTAELAHEIASRLAVPLQFVTYDAAGKVTAAVATGAWDIAFLAIDPKRAEEISFTPPYVIIEGGYLVAKESPLNAIAEVDRPGMRITVSRDSAYDLHLSRTIRNAQILRVPTGDEAIELFLREKTDAAAGVKGPLLRYAAAHPGLRVMDGRFMVIEQAMGTPRGHDAGLRYLRRFLDEMKASGAIAAALGRSGQHDALVAPASPVD